MAAWWLATRYADDRLLIAQVTAALFVCVTVPLAAHDMHMHLLHYVSPLQRFYVRILVLVPLYAGLVPTGTFPRASGPVDPGVASSLRAADEVGTAGPSLPRMPGRILEAARAVRALCLRVRAGACCRNGGERRVAGLVTKPRPLPLPLLS